MRPRVFPAEDCAAAAARPREQAVSMRPRVFPAEDTSPRPTTGQSRSSFNEAAGIPRGRRVLSVDDGGYSPASMRPRVFPAEDGGGVRSRGHAVLRFNEAAGIPRGRRSTAPAASRGPRRFNEAAGIPRGRLPGRQPAAAEVLDASMRPRVFPAEDTARCGRTDWEGRRFNEAAGIPRGRHRRVDHAGRR